MPNTLYYGDNLDILREHVPDESVDLVYLDPPFNCTRLTLALTTQASSSLKYKDFNLVRQIEALGANSS